jgi:hypothetical protein
VVAQSVELARQMQRLIRPSPRDRLRQILLATLAAAEVLLVEVCFRSIFQCYTVNTDLHS